MDKIITHLYSPGVCRFCDNIALRCYHLQLLPLTLRLIIVAERTMMFLRGDIDIVCIMHGVYLSTTTSTYYDVYQLLRSLTVILVDSSQFCDGHVIQQLLESVIRCSLTVLYTLDIISHYFYAVLDHCSQTRHTRRT